MTIPNPLDDREQYFRDQIIAGNFKAELIPIASEIPNHKAVFWVTSDALMIEKVRINNTATLQQQIADMLGCSLLTPKLADLLHAQAEIVIGPQPMPISSSTSAMKTHSAKIDKIIKDSPKNKLISTVGKHWCIGNELINKPNRAMNYGWHFSGSNYQGIKGYPCDSKLMDPKTKKPYHVIQPSAQAHDRKHADYSQICVLVSQECEVDGNRMKLSDVLTNAELAGLASHEGVVKILRQPGVNSINPIEYVLKIPPKEKAFEYRRCFEIAALGRTFDICIG